MTEFQGKNGTKVQEKIDSKIRRKKGKNCKKVTTKIKEKTQAEKKKKITIKSDEKNFKILKELKASAFLI